MISSVASQPLRRIATRSGTVSPLLLAMLVVTGCAAYRTEPAGPAGPAAYQVPRGTPASPGDQVVVSALATLGRPYRYGAEGPEAFDCSGLVEFAYAQAGFSVPRTSGDQYRRATPVPLAEARPGDLLFFRYGRKVSHVGIYLGDGRFIHAPSTGDHVSLARLSDGDYRARLVRAGRLLPAY